MTIASTLLRTAQASFAFFQRVGNHTVSRLATLCNHHQLYLWPACQLYRAYLRHQLNFTQRRAVINHNVRPKIAGSAPIGHQHVQSHPHCDSDRLKFCSKTLHVFLNNLTRSPHRRRILMVGNCMVQITHKRGIIDARRDVEKQLSLNLHIQLLLYELRF